MRMMFCRIDLDSPGIVSRGFVALCKSGLVKLLSFIVMKMNESRYVSSFESPQKNSRVVGFYQMQNTKSRRCSLVERSSAGASPCPCCRHRTSSQRPWRSAFCFQLEISMLSQCVAMLQSAGQDIFRLSLLCKQLTPGLEAMILFHLTREAFEVNTK